MHYLLTKSSNKYIFLQYNSIRFWFLVFDLAKQIVEAKSLIVRQYLVSENNKAELFPFRSNELPYLSSTGKWYADQTTKKNHNWSRPKSARNIKEPVS